VGAQHIEIGVVADARKHRHRHAHSLAAPLRECDPKLESSCQPTGAQLSSERPYRFSHPKSCSLRTFSSTPFLPTPRCALICP
jgi:hypothetical protein